jgi:hypothetical protein
MVMLLHAHLVDEDELRDDRAEFALAVAVKIGNVAHDQVRSVDTKRITFGQKTIDVVVMTGQFIIAAIGRGRFAWSSKETSSRTCPSLSGDEGALNRIPSLLRRVPYCRMRCDMVKTNH